MSVSASFQIVFEEKCMFYTNGNFAKTSPLILFTENMFKHPKISSNCKINDNASVNDSGINACFKSGNGA